MTSRTGFKTCVIEKMEADTNKKQGLGFTRKYKQ